MKSMTAKLMLTAALIAVAGCAKKQPAELPPPPPPPAAEPAPVYTPPVSSIVPGSRAEFLQEAGSDTVLFDTDKYDLDAEATATLARQAEWLNKYPNVNATIEGHCDERGTREYNLALGDRRANAAKNFLVSRGVDASRLSTISYGKERPLAMGSDEASWAQNRRAVTVVPE